MPFYYPVREQSRRQGGRKEGQEAVASVQALRDPCGVRKQHARHRLVPLEKAWSSTHSAIAAKVTPHQQVSEALFMLTLQASSLSLEAVAQGAQAGPLASKSDAHRAPRQVGL